MKISDAYLELQREMHRDSSYGTSGQNYAEDVILMALDHECKSILDYGCGKGTLKREIARASDIDVREYDPAIPGKDRDPDVADLVVCTDVLEHVEEEAIDEVLDAIRHKAAKKAYVVIDTAPARKSLPDGRNAHISLHDPDWWSARIGRFFRIDAVATKGRKAGFILTPWLMPRDIKTIAAVDNTERFANMRANVLLTPKRVALAEPHRRIAILVGYGPSLNQTYGDIAIANDFYNKPDQPGCDVVSTSGAHDFLIERGIIPRFHVEIDPRKHKGEMTALVDDRVTYLYASCCHPDVVGRLKDKDNLVLWHLHQGDASVDVIEEIEPGGMLVTGYGSVGLRAVSLLYAMGYRRMIIHGMDCSFAEDGSTHAGPHKGKPVDVITATSYGRSFLTSPVQMAYLAQFDEMRNILCGPYPNGIEMILCGDGMLQHSVRKAIEASEAKKVA